jgi:hypothetical protein
MSQKLFVAMSCPAAGREEEYARWYEDVHMQDVLRVPGIEDAQRFVRDVDQLPEAYTPRCPYSHVALYQADGDPGTIAHELARRAEGGVFQMIDAIAAKQGSFYELKSELQGPGERDGEGALLVFSRPAPGHSADEYDEWYDGIHLAEVLDVPGITAARRWHHSSAAMPQRLTSPPPHPDLAIYRTAAPASEIASEFERRLLDGTFRMSPALDMSSLMVWFFAATSTCQRPGHTDVVTGARALTS